jgi:hypothetical protein
MGERERERERGRERKREREKGSERDRETGRETHRNRDRDRSTAVPNLLIQYLIYYRHTVHAVSPWILSHLMKLLHEKQKQEH